MSLRGVGAKLNDTSVVGYTVEYYPTLHDTYKVWIPASDTVFAQMSVEMNKSGAYTKLVSPTPVSPCM